MCDWLPLLTHTHTPSQIFTLSSNLWNHLLAVCGLGCISRSDERPGALFKNDSLMERGRGLVTHDHVSYFSGQPWFRPGEILQLIFGLPASICWNVPCKSSSYFWLSKLKLDASWSLMVSNFKPFFAHRKATMLHSDQSLGKYLHCVTPASLNTV